MVEIWVYGNAWTKHPVRKSQSQSKWQTQIEHQPNNLAKCIRSKQSVASCFHFILFENVYNCEKRKIETVTCFKKGAKLCHNLCRLSIQFNSFIHSSIRQQQQRQSGNNIYHLYVCIHDTDPGGPFSSMCTCLFDSLCESIGPL